MKRVLAALALVVLLLAACSSPPRPHRVGLGGCSADVSTTLATYLTNLPDNSTVTLGHNACYTLATTLILTGINGLTIHGNGAKLQLTVPNGGYMPVVQMESDTNIKIDNLTMDGGSTPDNPGGEYAEGDYGIIMQADTNVVFSRDHIQNIQGDWVYLSPPYDTPSDGPQVNSGITFSQDTFLNAGYHGLTVESAGCPTQRACNGLTVANSTLTNAGVDAMDFEVDNYSSGVNAYGVADFFAENYVTISNDIWNNWGSDWFASIQGQGFLQPVRTTYGGTNGATVSSINTGGNLLLGAPIAGGYNQTGVGLIRTSGGDEAFTYTSQTGSTLQNVSIAGSGSNTVASGATVFYGGECPNGPTVSCGGVGEQHLKLIGNTLNANAPLFEIVGTVSLQTTSPYIDYAWTISNNHFGPGYGTTGYRGGGTPAGQIYSVEGLTMSGNSFVFQIPFGGSPGQYLFDIFNSSYLSITGNNFRGSLGAIQPPPDGNGNQYSQAVSVCNNKIGTGSTDASC